jgi:DNA polymerase-3 subunit beta
MRIKAKREIFLDALYWTQSTVERRNTMPILANVLVEAGDGTVRLTATDLEVGVRASLDAEVLDDGKVTANAKKLYEIVRELSEPTLELAGLKNHWVEVKSGKSVFKIVGLDPREFPAFAEKKDQVLSECPGKVIGDMIDKTIFSISTDETRSNLNGAFCEETGAGKVRMVTTDGHRLSLVERDIGSVGLIKGVIIPRKGLVELKRLVDDMEDGVVSIGFADNMAFAVKDNVELFMRLIEGEFPDYSKVIPEDYVSEVKVDQEGLLKALRRVSLLSSDRYRGIKLELKENQLFISANNPDLGEAVEEIDLEYQGQELAIGYNARYLLDVLGVLGQEVFVNLQFKDEQSPTVMRKEGDASFLYVVMPMRL